MAMVFGFSAPIIWLAKKLGFRPPVGTE